MGKKERQFSKSKAWVEWLSDDIAAGKGQKPSSGPVQPSHSPHNTLASRRQYTQRPPLRVHTAPQRQSLGLDPSAFRLSTHTHTSAAKKTSAATHKKRSPASVGADGAITINFHLPTFHLPKIAVNWRKVLIGGAVTVGIAGLIIATPYIVRSLSSSKGGQGQQSSTAAGGAELPYAPLVPSSDSSDHSITSKKYDAAKQRYLFNDTYKGVAITVSEQPIPESFKTNPAKLKELATSVGANEALDAADGVIYVSTDEGLTSQRAVYASKQLLLLITAAGVLKNSEWVAFIQSLE